MAQSRGGDQVLVTGASGFIAKHCIAELIGHGYRVVGTLRRPQAADEVRAAVATRVDPADRLSFVEAELLSDRGWADAVRGCRYVLHTASPYPARSPRNPDEVVRPAREGTLRVLTAARAAGVKRVVVTSSCAAIAGARHDKIDFDESDWAAAEAPRIRPYDRSKVLAERAAWDFVHQNPGMELAVINPAQVFGPPLDRHIETSGDILLSQLNGSLPRLARFGLPVADVRDVAAAHVAAMESPKAAGERFIVADAFLTVFDMAKILKRAFPQYARRLPRGEIPDRLARLLRPFVPALKTIGDDLGRVWRVSHAKVERVLGIRPRPAEEAIIAMGEALIRFGLVKPV